MPEETEVRRGVGADAPVEFRWNGQLHRVRAVLTHHRIRNLPATPPAGAVRPDLPRSRVVDEVVDELSARRAARAGYDEVDPDEVDPDEVDAAEPAAPGTPWHHQEVWRVRAGPVFTTTPIVPGVFDLRFDWAVGRWTVTRIDISEEEL